MSSSMLTACALIGTLKNHLRIKMVTTLQARPSGRSGEDGLDSTRVDLGHIIRGMINPTFPILLLIFF